MLITFDLQRNISEYDFKTASTKILPQTRYYIQ
jgi:hypothetical protein